MATIEVGNISLYDKIYREAAKIHRVNTKYWWYTKKCVIMLISSSWIHFRRRRTVFQGNPWQWRWGIPARCPVPPSRILPTPAPPLPISWYFKDILVQFRHKVDEPPQALKTSFKLLLSKPEIDMGEVLSVPRDITLSSHILGSEANCEITITRWGEEAAIKVDELNTEGSRFDIDKKNLDHKIYVTSLLLPRAIGKYKPYLSCVCGARHISTRKSMWILLSRCWHGKKST